MPFDITSYTDKLRQSLEQLSPQGRISFAAWCADSLYRDVCDYLAMKIDGEQGMAIQESLDYIWKCASGSVPVNTVTDRLEHYCAGIDWDEGHVADDEQLTNRYAIEALSALCSALETCKTGSAISAARTAENVINKLDMQLSDELTSESYSEAIWSDQKWKAELDRQQQMLSYLHISSALSPEQKSIFRE